MSDKWGFETRQIHVGGDPDPRPAPGRCRSTRRPRYQFRDRRTPQNLFALAEIGNIYTRIMNPTQGALEARLNSARRRRHHRRRPARHAGGRIGPGGRDARDPDAVPRPATTSCPSRRSTAARTTCSTTRFPKLGIEVTFVDDPRRPRAVARRRSARTPRSFFGEVLPNPKNDVFDIEGVARVAHDNGIPLIVDNTVPTPYLIRPIEWGADIVVHSLTKFIGGHGTSIGGAIIDGGTFDFGASGRFPNFTEPDPSYHGLAYWPALGPGSYIIKARVQMLRDIGASDVAVQRVPVPAGPRDAEPADGAALRQRRSKVAEFLRRPRRGGERVATPACRASPWHERATKYGARQGLRHRCIAFISRAGIEAGQKLRRGARAAQPRGQHRRRAQPGDPPGQHDPQPAHRGGAADHRRAPRAWCA